MDIKVSDFELEDLQNVTISKGKFCEPSDIEKTVDHINTEQVAYSAWNCAWIPPEAE